MVFRKMTNFDPDSFFGFVKEDEDNFIPKYPDEISMRNCISVRSIDSVYILEKPFDDFCEAKITE